MTVPQGRFTLLFERFAVDALLACASVSQACELLGIGWDAAHEIMKRAVARGLERRQMDQLAHLGMDENSIKRGHSYITLLTDLDQSRVLEVVADCTCEAADQLWATLTPEQKSAVEAVAVDLWEPFLQTIQKQVPAADIVHDRRGPPAQAASGKPADLSAPSHHQRRDGRIKLKNPESQIGSLRLPQLPQLPDSHPVFLWKTQPLPTMTREETNRILSSDWHPTDQNYN